MGWQVAITDEADADLANIVVFLARRSPAAAERLGLELVELISHSTNCRTAARRLKTACTAQGCTPALSRDLRRERSGVSRGDRPHLGQSADPARLRLP